jgi:hypothetical protein
MLGERHSDSLRPNTWVNCNINKGMHWDKRQNSLLRNRSHARAQHTQLQGLQETSRVTETTNVGESNGTNLNPTSSVLFFFFCYENRGVLILRPDSWHERSRSISTPRGLEVLRFWFHLFMCWEGLITEFTFIHHQYVILLLREQ